MEAGVKNFLGGFTVSAGGRAILHCHLLADVAPPADLLAARPLLVQRQEGGPLGRRQAAQLLLSQVGVQFHQAAAAVAAVLLRHVVG